MKVICINAKARHGKDTAAKLLKEMLEARGNRVIIVHFADLLKYICVKFFDWDGIKDVSGRSLLQHVGTDIIGAAKPNFWVDFVKDILQIFKHEWDYVLIPDCRFIIEAESMRANFDTKVIKIVRPNFDNGLTDEQKLHPSEVELDNYTFDAIIQNKGNLEDLRAELLNLINNKEI